MGEGKLDLPDDLISSKPSDHSWTFKGEASEGNEEDKALMGLLDESKVDTAVRVLKEGGMDAIKLEGGSPSRITTARAIVEAGIAVMGHVELTPLAISVLGGFRPQGKSVATTVKVVETALAL